MNTSNRECLKFFAGMATLALLSACGNISHSVRNGKSVEMQAWPAVGVAMPMHKDTIVTAQSTIKQSTLSTDAFFAFDHASITDITEDGKVELGRLARALIGHGQGVQNIHIVGYTDRLGSDSYNEDLSLKRAYAVMDYLVGHGVPSELIQAEGYGNADPVKDCPPSDQTSLIACLAPNRRVIVVASVANNTAMANESRHTASN